MKAIRIIFLIFFTSLFITECSRDDTDVVETGKGTGTLTVNGIEYALIEGIIYHNPGSANYDIDLISSLTNNGIGAETCHLVAFEMYTATSDGLQSGTYNYDTHGTSQAGTFTGLIAMDINKETEDCSLFYVIKSGTIVVNHSDAVYENTVDVMTDKYEYDAGEDDFVITESDVKITCYYIGSLKPSVH
jgi:hypothetical protein